MLKSWKTVSVSAALSAFILLGVITSPRAAELQNGGASTEVATAAPATAPTTENPAAPAAKEAPRKQQKSVLDAEALDKPFSFFNDTPPASEEEASDMSMSPNTLVLALKALVATLLSTIM